MRLRCIEPNASTELGTHVSSQPRGLRVRSGTTASLSTTSSNSVRFDTDNHLRAAYRLPHKVLLPPYVYCGVGANT